MNTPLTLLRRGSPERSAEPAIQALHRSILSMALLCEVLDAMPNLVMILNRNRQIVFGNKAVVSYASQHHQGLYLGLRPGELLSCVRATQAGCGCGTADECPTCGALQAILSGLEGRSSSSECRITRQTRAGLEAVDLRVWGKPLDWHGETLVLLTAADIASEKRRQMLDRVFLHDLLNLAGGLQGLIHLLDSGDLSLEEAQGDLSVTAGALIDEIQSQRILLAAENRSLAVQWLPLRSHALLDQVIQMFHFHEAARGRGIVRPFLSEDVGFCSDPTLLRRVLGNLLKNALEASAHGQEVALLSRRTETGLAFECANPAVIPPEVRMQMFQRSFTTKGAGRGLGAYSVKLLTEGYLHGKVTFVSHPETGTVFTVALPLHPGLDLAPAHGHFA